MDDLAEAARAEPRLIPLRDEPARTVDVAVIGAGVAGLSAAVAAARAGARVLVLEAASHIGCGATGQNAGILSAGINMALSDLPPESPERAMWLPDEGRIHPLTLLAHLARKAQAAGARLAGTAEVTSYAATARAGGRHRWRIHSAAGITITASGLILAAGPIPAAPARPGRARAWRGHRRPGCSGSFARRHTWVAGRRSAGAACKLKHPCEPVRNVLRNGNRPQSVSRCLVRVPFSSRERGQEVRSPTG